MIASSALGGRTPALTAIFYVITLLLFTAACGWQGQVARPPGPPGCRTAFGWQVKTLDIDDPATFLRFRSNRFVGWLFLTGIIAANFAT